MENTVSIDQFKAISVRGRMAYGAMCAEEYILNTRPEQNWLPIFKKIWDFNAVEYWDDWHDEMIDILPECFLEFQNYETSDFQVLTQEEYEAIKPLYEPIPKHWETIIKSIFSMEEAYAYSTISGNGQESLKALNTIIEILKSLNIKLPDFEMIQSCSFTDKKGWGKRFDCKPMSKILN